MDFKSPSTSDIVLGSIDRVTRYKSLQTRVPDEVHIHLDGKIIVTDMAKLCSPHDFVLQFFGLFGKILEIKKTDWINLAEAIAEQAVYSDPIENTALEVVNILLQRLACETEITPNREDISDFEEWAYLYDDGTFLWIPSAGIIKMLGEMPYKITVEAAREIATNLGFKIKTSGNENVLSVRGRAIRCWVLSREKILELRGNDESD